MFLLLYLACLPPDPILDDTGADTAANQDSDPDTYLVSTTGSDHCGPVEGDEVWAVDMNPHHLSCVVTFSNGTLTLGPGVVVEAALDSGLFISEASPATLRVLGTQESPVSILPDTGEGATGHWQGLLFFNSEDASPSDLRWLTVDGAGSGDGIHRVAGLFNESPELRVEEVQITRSAGYGFVLSLEGSFSPDSSGLHVTESAVSAFAEVWATGTIPDGDLTGNEIDAIDLPGGQVKESARWDAKNVDYRLLNDTYVDGIDGEPVTLTLGPGTTLQFGDSRGLYVGYSGPAALIAVGTEKAPLLFRGERKIAGSWAGVGIRSNDSGSRLEHFELSHGGTSFPLDGALHLQEAATSVDQGYIHDNAECGIWLDGGTSELGPNMVYEENDEGDLCGPEDED